MRTSPIDHFLPFVMALIYPLTGRSPGITVAARNSRQIQPCMPIALHAAPGVVCEHAGFAAFEERDSREP
jgi:hypothetical protein